MEQYYTINETIAILKIKRTKLYDLLKKGLIECYIAKDGRKYFTQKQIENFVKNK